MPPPPAAGADESERRVWEKEIDTSMRENELLEENLKIVYSLLWGQCTGIIKARIEALNEQ
jgi:hypothetical protein